MYLSTYFQKQRRVSPFGQYAKIANGEILDFFGTISEYQDIVERFSSQKINFEVN